MKSKKLRIDFKAQKVRRPYLCVRVDDVTEAELNRAAKAHTKNAGRPVTKNKLIARYVKYGLSADSILKKAS